MAKGDICNYIIFIEKVYQLYIYTSSRKELFIFMEHCTSISNEHCTSIS